MHNRIESLEERLVRAERMSRISAFIAMATVVFAIAVGCGSNSYKTLKAERIEIIDQNGTTVGLLFGDEQGGGLSLDDSEGKPRIALAATQNNPRMEMYDPEGNVRVALNTEEKGSALVLCDPSGTPRANLFYYDDQSWVGFFDAQGKLTTKIPEE